MILHSRNPTDGQHCYMVKYWPSMGMVFIKAVATQPLDPPKRKLGEMTQDHSGKGKGKGHGWKDSGWQDRSGWRQPGKNPWRATWETEEEDTTVENTPALTYDKEGRMVRRWT
eukprot:2940488-Heterocapsa_arctica.AAC.1